MTAVTVTSLYLRDGPDGLDVAIDGEHYGPPGEFVAVTLNVDGNSVSLRGQRGSVIGALQAMLDIATELTAENYQRSADLHLGREAEVPTVGGEFE